MTIDEALDKLELALASGTRVVETPQLGRVERPGAAELLTAIGYFRAQAAALEAGSASRTQPVIALRGLHEGGGY